MALIAIIANGGEQNSEAELPLYEMNGVLYCRVYIFAVEL
jgi:hypothetical protein